MPERVDLRRCVERIFEDKLNLIVPALDTDLFATGALDSLSFVELLVELERECGVKMSLEDLELANFQSVGSIVAFLAARLGSKYGRAEGSCAVPAERDPQAERG